MKRILKDILYEQVPRKLLDRPKRGFIPPMKDWFRGELREELTDTVSATNIRTLLPELGINRIITLRDSFLNGMEQNTQIFFTIYTWVRWYNHYKSSISQ